MDLRKFFSLVFAVALVGCDGSVSDPRGGEGGADAAAMPGVDAGSDVCAEVEVSLEQAIPTVWLLIDQSGSMTQSFGGTDRWTAVYRTLMDPMTGAVKSLENNVRFGLALYTSNQGNAGGVCPILTEVPPALGNYAAIDAVFAGATPQRDTPTGEAIQQVAAKLAMVNEPGPKVILLATDGEPDTCEDPNGHDDAARNKSIQATQAAYALNMETFVISVGADVSAAHLQDLANAGAGLPVGGATNAPYYRALNGSELVSAFDTIINGVRECKFTLDGQIDPELADQGTVTLDGNPLQYGVDWILTDGSTLELLGAACETIKDGDHTLSARFPCGAIIL